MIECLGYVFNSHLHGSLRERLYKCFDVGFNSKLRQDLESFDCIRIFFLLTISILTLDSLMTQRALNREE